YFSFRNACSVDAFLKCDRGNCKFLFGETPEAEPKNLTPLLYDRLQLAPNSLNPTSIPRVYDILMLVACSSCLAATFCPYPLSRAMDSTEEVDPNHKQRRI